MTEFLLILEIIGTVAFAVSGAMTGLVKKMDIFGVVILGLTTAVGGGLMQDVMAGNTPYIFVKHVYASASIIGAILCAALWQPLGGTAAMIIGATVILTVRLLAAHYHWSLPRA